MYPIIFKEEVILDPFIGSGQTAIAAIKTGRYSVGYEINEEYVKRKNELRIFYILSNRLIYLIILRRKRLMCETAYNTGHTATLLWGAPHTRKCVRSRWDLNPGRQVRNLTGYPLPYDPCLKIRTFFFIKFLCSEVLILWLKFLNNPHFSCMPRNKRRFW